MWEVNIVLNHKNPLMYKIPKRTLVFSWWVCFFPFLFFSSFALSNLLFDGLKLKPKIHSTKSNALIMFRSVCKALKEISWRLSTHLIQVNNASSKTRGTFNPTRGPLHLTPTKEGVRDVLGAYASSCSYHLISINLCLGLWYCWACAF